ncbi:MAG: hypothetical protein P8Y97_21890 [Candidatus Lokiarchaeota archaeon]
MAKEISYLHEITVFLSNESGKLFEMLSLIRDNDIALKSISVAQTNEYGLVALLVDKADKCLSLLKENGYDVSDSKVLAVKVLETQPETLFDLAEILAAHEINIEYLYTTVSKKNTIMIVKVNESEKAQETLLDYGFNIIDKNEL